MNEVKYIPDAVQLSLSSLGACDSDLARSARCIPVRGEGGGGGEVIDEDGAARACGWQKWESSSKCPVMLDAMGLPVMGSGENAWPSLQLPAETLTGVLL